MSTGAHPTRHWHALPGERVQCDVCPRACELAGGQRGLCFVRQNTGGAVVLTTYGRSSGFCIDPIEKKPLNHFFPGSPVLSFGTAGCNLTCRFCQNWDISKSREVDTLADRAMPQDIAAAAVYYECRSVAFTYNDPVIFLEYAVDTAVACREKGIAAVAVTAGYICDAPRREMFAVMDAANVDLKGFTESFYKRLCSAELEAVKDTLRYLHHETDVWLEITTLLIPGENDSEAEIDAMTQWIAGDLGLDIPVHFTAFHPDYRMLKHLPTPASTLRRARSIAMRNGLRYVYTGNIRDEEGGSTCCPGCGVLLIGRDSYDITHWGLDSQGRCASCGHAIAGHFDAQPGGWGARRAPVHIGKQH